VTQQEVCTRVKVRHHSVIAENGLQKLPFRVSGSSDSTFGIACANLGCSRSNVMLARARLACGVLEIWHVDQGKCAGAPKQTKNKTKKNAPWRTHGDDPRA